jgi:hypothetical protein
MSNLDDVIKDILGNMYYDVSDTLSEQKLVKGVQTPALTNYLNQSKTNPLSVGIDPLGIFNKQKTPQPSVGVSNQIVQFDTCVRGMSFRIAARGSDFGIKPITWLNRDEPYNQDKARMFFGTACKFWSKIPSTSQFVEPSDQYFFNQETLLPCQAIYNNERYTAYNTTDQEIQKNKTKNRYNTFVSNLQKIGQKKWNEILKKSNGQIFKSGNGWFEANGKKIPAREYTYEKNCIRITEDVCLKLSWQSLHLNSNVGMKTFATIDRRKDKNRPTKINWCACTGKQLSFDNLTSENKADYYATTNFKYPWDYTYIGFKNCAAGSGECLMEPQKIVPVDIQFKLPGNEIGSLDFQQKQNLLQKNEVPMENAIRYNLYGVPYDASATFGKQPTITPEEIQKRQQALALFGNGAIIPGT